MARIRAQACPRRFQRPGPATLAQATPTRRKPEGVGAPVARLGVAVANS